MGWSGIKQKKHVKLIHVYIINTINKHTLLHQRPHFMFFGNTTLGWFLPIDQHGWSPPQKPLENQWNQPMVAMGISDTTLWLFNIAIENHLF